MRNLFLPFYLFLILPLSASISETDQAINQNIDNYPPVYMDNFKSWPKTSSWSMFSHVYKVRLVEDDFSETIQPRPWRALKASFLGYTHDETVIEVIEKKIVNLAFLKDKYYLTPAENEETNDVLKRAATLISNATESRVVKRIKLKDVIEYITEHGTPYPILTPKIVLNLDVSLQDFDIKILNSGWVKNTYGPAKVYMIDLTIQ